MTPRQKRRRRKKKRRGKDEDDDTGKKKTLSKSARSSFFDPFVRASEKRHQSWRRRWRYLKPTERRKSFAPGSGNDPIPPAQSTLAKKGGWRRKKGLLKTFFGVTPKEKAFIIPPHQWALLRWAQSIDRPGCCKSAKGGGRECTLQSHQCGNQSK